MKVISNETIEQDITFIATIEVPATLLRLCKHLAKRSHRRTIVTFAMLDVCSPLLSGSGAVVG